MEGRESQNVEYASENAVQQQKHHPEYEILLNILKENEERKKKSSTAPDVEKHQGNEQDAGLGKDIPVGKPSNVVEMEKFPPTELTTDQKDESCKAGESKNAILKKKGDEAEKGVLRKRTSSELNAVMEGSMNKEERVVTRRRSARVSRKAIIEVSMDEDAEVETEKGLPRNKEAAHEDARVATKKPSSLACKGRNVMKTSRNNKEGGKEVIKKFTPTELTNDQKRNLLQGEGIGVEKISGPESKKPRDEDERGVLRKRTSSESRNTVMEGSMNEEERVVTCRRRSAHVSRKAIIEISSDEDAEVEIEKGLPRNKEAAHEDVRVETKKPSSLACKGKNVMKSSGNNKEVIKKSRKLDGVRTEIKKRSTSESRKSAHYHNGPFVSSVKVRDVRENSGVTPTDPKAEFRRRVLEIISKPYDKIEYLSVKEEFDSKYYTDYHPELGNELVKNRHNRRKRLALMRGFYFYTENCEQEGAFQPWRDDICLDVEPQPLTPGSKSGK